MAFSVEGIAILVIFVNIFRLDSELRLICRLGAQHNTTWNIVINK